MSDSDVVPLQFVQFTNDVLFVSYSDGSSLQLSPCGNQFVHEIPTDSDSAAFSGLRRVQQKTEFATSAFRAKVREALQFRNMFAECPFLCSLLDGEEEEEDVDGTVRWPTDTDSVVVTPNGRLQLQADSPQSCVVHLSANRQEFRSEFCVRPPNSLRTIRVTGHHSLRNVQRCWKPAVNLILRAVGIPSEEDKTEATNLPLPSPLPLRCPRQHLHRFEASIPSPSTSNELGWLLCGEGKRFVKVLCLEGVLYRLHLPPHLSVEIFPGDGSLLVSNNLSGCFFTHFIPTTVEDGEELPSVIERVYSSSNPPPSHPHKVDYDLSRVLSFGARLTEYLADCLTILGNDDLENPSHCCWRSTQGEEDLEREFERVLGRRSRIAEKREENIAERQDQRSKENTGSERSLPQRRDDRKDRSDSERSLPQRRDDRKERNDSERSLPQLRGSSDYERSLSRSKEDNIHRWREGVGSDTKSDGIEHTAIISEAANVEDEERGDEEDMEEMRNRSRRILDKQEVPDVGTFTAGVAGRIHILFVDRVSLDMRADLSRRLVRDSLPLPPPDVCPDLPPMGYVRLFTREGKFETVPFHDTFYGRYISAAQEWIDWVNASIDERRVFYTERPQLPCPSTELKKIECFNYILDHSNTKLGVGNASNGPDPESTGAAERARQIKSIEDTLARTSNFLRELESLRSSQR